jgi:ABC-2 type transport system ATP-binding protein
VGEVRKVDDIEGRIDRWLRFFDLQETKGTLCKDLSKGMRQKVMLSAAFIHEPELLFLDEPFVNLDPIYQHKLREYLLELRGHGRTIFLCSHILEMAQKLCQEMVIINRGRVIASGSVAELTAREDLETLFLRTVGEDVTT